MNATLITNVAWTATVQKAGNTVGEDQRRWTACLMVSSILGAATGLGGLVIGILKLTGSAAALNGSIGPIGAVLIVASFLSFLAAAHCIDRLDNADKAARLEYCRKHGLKEDGERGTA